MLGFPLWETFVASGVRLWGWASTPWLKEWLASLYGALLPPMLCLPHPVLSVSNFTHLPHLPHPCPTSAPSAMP